MQPIKYIYIQNFMFVGVSIIEILEFNQKKKKMRRTWQNCEIPYYKYYIVLQDFADFFQYH